jgi:lipid II isoglutaminyl synthase (glutamine-hydrolysing)
VSRLLLILLSYFAKTIAIVSRLLGRGSGTSLPGLVVELYCPWVLGQLNRNFDQIIMISGTNGKTTTRALLVHIYESNGLQVCTNRGGANIMRGLASSLLLNLDWLGKPVAKTAILEVEEATLPRLTKYLKPGQLLLTNIFRDQLDAYGEIDQTLRYFQTTLKQSKPKLFVNLDDSKLVSAVRDYSDQIYGFQLHIPNDQKPKFESDQPVDFEAKQTFTGSQINFTGQLTKFSLTLKSEPDSEELSSPGFQIQTSLPGVFNVYNVLAAFALSYEQFGQQSVAAISNFQPVFGRGEKVTLGQKEISIMLVKNPAGFDQVLDYLNQIHSTEPINLAILINDKIADGKDVSWLWDVNLEKFVNRQQVKKIYTGGSRGVDILLRLQIAGSTVELEDNLPMPNLPTLLIDLTGPTYILATYTAMREIRDILAAKSDLAKMHAKGN